MLLPRLILSLPLISSRVRANAVSVNTPEDYDVLQYINPLIGSANGGKHHNFPITHIECDV
jgi:hypothetical protein